MEDLIILKDAAIKDIYTEQEGFEGCPTCDYGSSYTTYVRFKGRYRNKQEMFDISISKSQMYAYPGISMSKLIMFCVKNYNLFGDATLEEFLEVVRKEVFEEEEEE